MIPCRKKLIEVALPAPLELRAAPLPGGMVDDLAAAKKRVEKLGGEQVRRIVSLFE
jgi:hypothetical protein